MYVCTTKLRTVHAAGEATTTASIQGRPHFNVFFERADYARLPRVRFLYDVVCQRLGVTTTYLTTDFLHDRAGRT